MLGSVGVSVGQEREECCAAWEGWSAMHRIFVVVRFHAVLQSADLLQEKLQQTNRHVVSNDI